MVRGAIGKMEENKAKRISKKVLLCVSFIVLALFIFLFLFIFCGVTSKIGNQNYYEKQALNARNILSNLDTSDSDVVYSDKTKIDDKIIQDLDRQIDDYKAEGIVSSFIVVKPETGQGFSYNADWKFTSQSTIKAPYLASLIYSDPSSFEKHKEWFKAAITVSDNDAYENLRALYGNEPLVEWCETLSLPTEITEDWYPCNITVRELAVLWTQMYQFLNDKNTPEEFVSYFGDTYFSAISQELGQKYKVQTKAGWEDGIYDDTNKAQPEYLDGNPENGETATNDSGIVYSDAGDYIVIIFTNVASEPDKLLPLEKDIDLICEQI